MLGASVLFDCISDLSVVENPSIVVGDFNIDLASPSFVKRVLAFPVTPSALSSLRTICSI